MAFSSSPPLERFGSRNDLEVVRGVDSRTMESPFRIASGWGCESKREKAYRRCTEEEKKRALYTRPTGMEGCWGGIRLLRH